jgi:hypothetical protein
MRCGKSLRSGLRTAHRGRAVQHPHDLDTVFDWAIDDQIVAESHAAKVGPQIAARTASRRHVGEPLAALQNAGDETGRIDGAVSSDMDPDVFEISLGSVSQS